MFISNTKSPVMIFGCNMFWKKKHFSSVYFVSVDIINTETAENVVVAVEDAFQSSTESLKYITPPFIYTSNQKNRASFNS